MRPRRLALLGFGHVAEHGHLPAWQARDDFEVVAVADPAPARLARAAELVPGARRYNDPAAALAAEHLDAADIATPPALHAPLAARAAAAGCHVLCEKPLATSPAGYRAAAAAARTAGTTLFTVHNWKHAPQFAQLAAWIAEGAVGRATHVRLSTERTGCAGGADGDWRSRAGLAGGGILVDHGWHALYLLLAAAGERPRAVRAKVERRRDPAASVEDTATCEVHFPSVVGEIFLTWAGSVRRTCWELRGTDGSVVLADAGGELVRRGARRTVDFSRSLSAGSHHPDWFGAVIDDFAAEIGDPSRRGCNLAEAEMCVLLTALAYQSSAEGGRLLAVPPAFPELAARASAA